DGVFAFDKSDLKNLTEGGKVRLQNLAQQIKQFGSVQAIEITGYTDPLGSDAYNRTLSAQRANTVKQYLGSMGIPLSVMSTRGGGETTAFAQCDKHMGKKALVACLSPNRRVTLKVTGLQKSPAAR